MFMMDKNKEGVFPKMKIKKVSNMLMMGIIVAMLLFTTVAYAYPMTTSPYRTKDSCADRQQLSAELKAGQSIMISPDTALQLVSVNMLLKEAQINEIRNTAVRSYAPSKRMVTVERNTIPQGKRETVNGRVATVCEIKDKSTVVIGISLYNKNEYSSIFAPTDNHYTQQELQSLPKVMVLGNEAYCPMKSCTSVEGSANAMPEDTRAVGNKVAYTLGGCVLSRSVCAMIKSGYFLPFRSAGSAPKPTKEMMVEAAPAA